MMVCSRCHAELSSEAAARRHFAQAHTDEQPLADLSLSLYGLVRAEQQTVVRLVERLRAGGDIGERLRAKVLAALADAAELEGNRAEVAAIEALA